jgi:hypothetical protein
MNPNNPLGFDLGEDKFAGAKDENGDWKFDKSIIE